MLLAELDLGVVDSLFAPDFGDGDKLFAPVFGFGDLFDDDD